MKKTAILILFTLLSAAAFSQSMKIVDFYQNEHDQTANNEATKMTDDNNEVCALIRIETTQKGFSFEGGTIGIVKVDDNHNGEIWVYVPAGLRRISIFHSTFGVIRDWEFPLTLMQARTYVMTLVTEGAATKYGTNKPNNQYLEITVTPKEAMVEVDDEIIDMTNGKGNKLVSLGKHTYRAQLRNYRTESGKVDVSDPDHKTTLTIDLKPAFGYLNVTGNSEMSGARVYVNSEFAGTVPLSNYRVSSGKANVRIAKDMYKEQSQYEVFTDGSTVNVTANLQPKFSTVTLEGDAGDSIFINDKFKGISSWTGRLEYGEYIFKASRDGHRPAYQEMRITPAVDGKVNLPAPTPIYGSINVNVTPSGAKILLDGSDTQESTPSMFNRVLAGRHRITVKSYGYDDFDTTIVVSESNTTTISRRMKEITRCDMTISPSSIYFKSSKSSEEVKIYGPCDWSLDYSSVPYWLTAKVSGNEVKVSAEKNKSYSERSANLRLNYQNGSTGRIAVNQSGKKYHYVSTPKYYAYEDFISNYGTFELNYFSVGAGIASALTVDVATCILRMGPVTIEPATFSCIIPLFESESFLVGYEPKLLFDLPTHGRGCVTFGGGISMLLTNNCQINPLAQVGYRIYARNSSFDFYLRYNKYFVVGITWNFGILSF